MPARSDNDQAKDLAGKVIDTITGLRIQTVGAANLVIQSTGVSGVMVTPPRSTVGFAALAMALAGVGMIPPIMTVGPVELAIV